MRYFIKKRALAADEVLEKFIQLDEVRQKISQMRSRYGSLLKEHKSLTEQLELKRMSLKRLDGSPLNDESTEKERLLAVRVLTNEIAVWERTHGDFRKLPLEIKRLEEEEARLQEVLSEYQAIETGAVR